MSEPDVEATLDEVGRFVRRFVVLNSDQITAIALWTFHSHAIGSSDTTAYLGISSAEKRSGKTLLLELLSLVVKQPLPTANISDAALFRAIAKLEPTLLFDEIDAVFGPKARDREDLRGLLNAGYRRGAVAWRMGGANNTSLEAFPVYCAKAFAGIGSLPDTIADRSISIRLERRTRDEVIERFRRRDVAADAEPILLALESLAGHHADRLACARPDLPDALDDRAQDCWEPLFAVADLAGGTWPRRARNAAVALSAGEGREDDSLGACLLSDIRRVFGETETDRYRTADLIAELSKIEESPWGDWYGKTISPQALGKLLKPYRIKTMPIWIDGSTVRGYKAEQFKDAWLRVVGVRGVSGVRSVPSIEAGPNAPSAPSALYANANGDAPRLLIGDAGYAMQLDRDLSAGLLSESSHREHLHVDALVSNAFRLAREAGLQIPMAA